MSSYNMDSTGVHNSDSTNIYVLPDGTYAESVEMLVVNEKFIDALEQGAEVSHLKSDTRFQDDWVVALHLS